MANPDDKLKEALSKKTVQEIEVMISTSRKKISEEKDLMKLSHLNSELSMLMEIRDKKINASSRQVRKTSTSAKPVLKSFDDYIKSKR